MMIVAKRIRFYQRVTANQAVVHSNPTVVDLGPYHQRLIHRRLTLPCLLLSPRRLHQRQTLDLRRSVPRLPPHPMTIKTPA